MARQSGTAVAPITVPDLGSQLAALEQQQDSEVLRAEWARLYRAAVPERLSRDLLIRGIAYRLQESALGGLRPATKRKLAGLIAAAGEGSSAQPTPSPATRLKPGAVLVRTWHGTTHTVLVVDDGFEYHGQRYASLSQIAERITGAHWSGPRFFGLKQRTKADAGEGAHASAS
jgi:hypothetical protein